jgi:N-acetylglutamate synthase-like GNAT family acetyltransferase
MFVVIPFVMKKIIDGLVFSSAETKDTAEIIGLYNSSYEGFYPDPIFANYQLLKNEILRKNKKLYVVRNETDVVGCIGILYDPENRIARAGSIVVLPECQGQNLSRKMIEFGIFDLRQNTKGISLLYLTSRTVHKSMQFIANKMGFKQLGIFPNAHKIHNYETHILSALYFNESENQKPRFINFKQHPMIKPLFDIVRDECGLPDILKSTDFDIKDFNSKMPILEFIHASGFVKASYQEAKNSSEIDLGFFPFHEPTAMITSPEGSIQVYVCINQIDKHCVITGVKIDKKVSFTDLFLKVSNMLRDQGVRYIEMIARANRLNIIDKIINAKYIPCGYVPGFQLDGDYRYDYAVFSRSFEILELNDIELTGVSQLYLNEYVKSWSKISLRNFLSENIS